jgi:aspartyl protease family protein
MSFSSGTRSLVVELGSWAVAGVVGVVALIHFDDIRHFARNSLGPLSAAATVQRIPEGRPASETPRRPVFGPTVELKRGDNGHFQADIEVNGRRLPALVDTGATGVALPYEAAENAGIYLSDQDFRYEAQTANGTARIAVVRLDRISIGDIVVHDVEATVAEPGLLHITLLGMTFLNRLSKTEIQGKSLILQQ